MGEREFMPSMHILYIFRLDQRDTVVILGITGYPGDVKLRLVNL
jgi:hypothetical protein